MKQLTRKQLREITRRDIRFHEEALGDLPEYGKDESKVAPGLYLGLFHGARTIKERKANGDVGQWGSNGPMIGPLKFVHTTYGCHIKLEFVREEDAHKYNLDTVFLSLASKDSRCRGRTIEADCINYRGVNYGDWTVYNVGGKA